MNGMAGRSGTMLGSPAGKTIALHDAILPESCASALPSRRMKWALAALAVGLAIAWLPVHLTLPLGRGQAMIGLVAERMLEGYWPYADSWDHRGPAAYALYAAMIWIGGNVAIGIAVGDLFFLAVAAGAMRAIGRSLAQPWMAPIGAIAMVLTVRDAQNYGLPDLWLASIWLWVLAAFMHPVWMHRLRSFAIAGAVAGIAVMVKPVFAILLALPLLLAAQARDPRRASATLAGFVATSGAVIAIFAIAGRLDALVDVYLAFNLFAHAGPGGDSLLIALARFLVSAVAPWFDVGAAAMTITACLGARVMARHDPARMRVLVLVLAWAIGLACVLVQGKSHQHHFAFANAAVAVLVAYAMSCALHWLAAAAAAERQEFSFRLVLTGAIAIAGVALAVQVHAARAANWWSAQLGLIPIAAHDASYCRPDHCHVDTRLAAEFIRRETDRTTPFFLFGTDAGLYIAADRPPATRFLSSYPLVGRTSAWTARLRVEAIASLRATSPHFIVVQDFDSLRTRRHMSSRQHLDDFPELRALLAERYDQAHHLGRFVLYRLKNAVVADAGEDIGQVAMTPDSRIVNLALAAVRL